MDGSSVKQKVRAEGVLVKLPSGILTGSRQASGSGWASGMRTLIQYPGRGFW